MTSFIYFQNHDFFISQSLGMNVVGIIGFDLFKDFVISINYLSKKIELTHFKHFTSMKKKKMQEIDIEIDKGKPLFTTHLYQDTSRSIPVKLLIDSGASFALSLLVKNQIKLPKNHIPAFLGFSLTGSVQGNVGYLDKMNIGHTTLKKPIAYFTELDNLTSLLNKTNREGSMGGEILKRFHWIFNYREKKVLVRPTSRVRNEFQYNRSGMQIVNPIVGLQVYVISHIHKNSPAAMSYLLEGDQVVSINGKPAHSLSMEQIYQIINSVKTKKIYMTILRSGTQIRKVLFLKDIL